MLKSIAEILIIVVVTILAAASLSTNQSLPASQKLLNTWTELISDPESADWFSSFSLIGILFESMKPSFDHSDDWIPRGRKKLVHSQGMVAKIRFVPSNIESDLTGIFSSGAQYGIARASTAKKPSSGTDEFLTPGLALKFFRDGVPSANTILMHSLEPQTGGNYFQHILSNHVASPKSLVLRALSLKFKQASKFPFQLGLSDMARFDETGKESNPAVFPFKLNLVPNQNLQSSSEEYTAANWKDQFVSIEKGTILYRVYGWSSPEDNGLGVYLGQIELVDEFTQSQAGDRELFFQHVRIEDDLLYQPNWRY